MSMNKFFEIFVRRIHALTVVLYELNYFRQEIQHTKSVRVINNVYFIMLTDCEKRDYSTARCMVNGNMDYVCYYVDHVAHPLTCWAFGCNSFDDEYNK